MMPPGLRHEFDETTEADLAAMVAKANDPAYMAGVDAMLDRIRSKPRIPTVAPERPSLLSRGTGGLRALARAFGSLLLDPMVHVSWIVLAIAVYTHL
ncbi:MAG: hypothetical protein JWN86_3601 [Planctomycetota bacterium]|nr:hypothetical protein [Planctomycetota bacterium]